VQGKSQAEIGGSGWKTIKVTGANGKIQWINILIFTGRGQKVKKKKGKQDSWS